MLSTRTLDDRFELARRFATPLSLCLWIGSEVITYLRVSGVWLVPLLALALVGVTLPTKGVSPTRHPRPWTAVGVACALILVGGTRVGIVAEESGLLVLFVALLCGEAMTAAVPVAIGSWIDGMLAPRLERGRGRMRIVSIAAMLCATAFAGVALARFSGRAEPLRGTFSAARGTSRTAVGLFQPLGSRCPIRCDEGPAGTRRDQTRLLANVAVDELAPGATLERTRLDAMNTRARILVTPEGSAPRYVFDHVLPPGQALRVAIDPPRQHLELDLGQHPRTTIRLADGVVYTEAARPDIRLTVFHAPTAYVLVALSGVALAAWLLRLARRSRRSIDDQSSWRDATVGEDRMIQFEKDLPPTRVPEWFSGYTRHVVVTSFAAPVGVGYRSDGVVTIHSMFAGSRADLITHLTVRATSLEHAAFASVALTIAPLVGAWAFGEAW